MRITDGVEALEIAATVMGRVITVHPALLWDEHNTILVDTGFPGQLALFQDTFAQAGVAWELLNTIILTHHDIDHIGSLASIRANRGSAVKVLAHEIEKPYIEGTKTPLKLAPMEANLNALPDATKEIYSKLKAGFQSSFAPVDGTLTDGEELPYCGGITVIFTPGHTLGHICLYLKASQTLIAGDALTADNGKLALPPTTMNFDTDQSRQSLKKLAAYPIRNVICYHGGVVRDIHPGDIAKLLEA